MVCTQLLPRRVFEDVGGGGDTGCNPQRIRERQSTCRYLEANIKRGGQHYGVTSKGKDMRMNGCDITFSVLMANSIRRSKC